jgi:hypothetical protein
MAGAAPMTILDDDAEINRIMNMPEHELAAELAKEGKTMEGVAAEMRQITQRAIAEAARRRAADPRLYLALRLWHRFAPESHTDWDEESHKAKYLGAIDAIETGIKRMTTPAADTTIEKEQTKLYLSDAELIRRLGVPEK